MPPTAFRRVVPVLVTAMALVPGSPALATTFTLTTLGTDGSLPSSHYSGDHSMISADGTWVVYRSSETNLVTPPTSGYQIFLRDLVLDTTELVSRNDGGDFGDSSSDWPSISNDGCRVAFESDAANLVAGDTNATTDVFVRDRCASTTLLASVSSAGVKSTGQSKRANISADGQVVVFWSYATDLVSTTPHAGQIYRRNLATQTTQLISDNVNQDGRGANYGSDCPAVSNDGSRVAFWSQGYDMVAGDDHTVWDIFVYDANASPHISLVSSSTNGVPQNQGGNGISSITCPAISGDGRFVAWASDSTNLVSDDTNGESDIFVKDTLDGTLERASSSTAGVEGNAGSAGRPSLSLDGTWVAFNTSATNLAAETEGKYPTVVLHNTQTGETLGLAASTSSDDPALSPDLNGRFVATYFGDPLDPLHASAGVFRCDRNDPPATVDDGSGGGSSGGSGCASAQGGSLGGLALAVLALRRRRPHGPARRP